MENDHVHALIDDYALGLLTVAQRDLVEQHAVRCAACRQELQAARAVSRQLAESLSSLPAPSGERLAALRPPAPVSPGAPFDQTWVRAAATLVVMLVLAANLLASPSWPWSSTSGATIAATSTLAPTATSTITPVVYDQGATSTPLTTTPIADLAVSAPFRN